MEANEPHPLTPFHKWTGKLTPTAASRVKTGNNGIVVASPELSLMKKVFLLFSIAALTSASAQQKDVFDMNRHVQELFKNMNTRSTRVKTFETDKFFSISSPSQPKQSYILPNADKVYLLLGDNMPCVVPDIKQFTAMPNISNPNEYFESLLSRQHLPGNISNVVTPYRLIASR